MEKDKLWEVCIKIYREQFKKAEPSADFDKLRESGETEKEDFFMNYYLSMEEQEAIIKKHSKGLSRREKRNVEFTVHLGCSPNSSKKTWEERNKV